MAIKKSELYSSIWKSCDELRGGMDASQYKDYVLVILFIKYVSDKYAGQKDALIDIPEGCSFTDMIALKGTENIGDDINKKIIKPIAEANGLVGIIDITDFNDEDKLGKGKDMIDRLSNLVSIFEKPELDFSKNQAEGDDILGDAYEYLMRHFATQSGKSKGQFYTPAEVSRIMAKVIGINATTKRQDTVYDPTCGSGSLLLKVTAETPNGISVYGQEMDNSTYALAIMNLWLHGYPDVEIKKGNTLSTPLHKNDETETEKLKAFDYVVANPPFSFKAWSNGFVPGSDLYKRFQYGIPPDKNGDYAFLLHILASMKADKGKGAVILPHGVLFRGNTEATIRRNILKKGFIKGIIGLPPNLFYGTGIPACIIVLDKEHAKTQTGVFMIDASKGFIKDGNKNRLREQDIHKIVDVFNRQTEVPKYARLVGMEEIEKNDFNLNIPRYIDSMEEEDIQNIEAHLSGGIPNEDIEALEEYWQVYPSLKAELFSDSDKDGFCNLNMPARHIRASIFGHSEFREYAIQIDNAFLKWKENNIQQLRNIAVGDKPKQIIYELSENLLAAFANMKLINNYDLYQHLMNYWHDTMQDDVYVLATDGWQAGNTIMRKYREGKNAKKETVKKEIEGMEGLEGRLIPPQLIIEKYFSHEQEAIDQMIVKCESISAKLEELKEEQANEDGLLAEAMDEKGRVTKTLLQKRIKECKNEILLEEELSFLNKCLQLMLEETELYAQIDLKKWELEKSVIAKYPSLSIDEILTIVVENKWMKHLHQQLHLVMDEVSQALAKRIQQLAERYEYTLQQLADDVAFLEDKVMGHLQTMGFTRMTLNLQKALVLAN